MYAIKMTSYAPSKWYWYIYSKNGKEITSSKTYENRTQCRTVMLEFSRLTRIPYKEIE